MATIDEIFESMADISDELEESIDSALLIDPNTRQINVPGKELIFGVESDGKSERKYFMCPRYVGNGLDLSSCFIRINYRNAQGDVDAHLVDDVRVVGDSVLFSWELTPKVTQYMGQVKFLVCAIHDDQEWHTTLATGTVLEGLEPDGEAVVEATSDVIGQLLVLVQSQGESVQATAEAARIAVEASIEAKGTNTLSTIPEDYQTLNNEVYGLKKTRATAIICDAAGTAVAMNDASDNPFNGLRVFGRSTQDGVPSPTAPVEIVSVEPPTVVVTGKNLLNNTIPTHTSAGVTYTRNEDGSITIDGTATAESYYLFDSGNEIKIQNIPLIASMSGGNGKVTFVIGYFKKDGSFENRLGYSVDDETAVVYPEEAVKTRNYLVVAKGGSFENLTVSPMLRVSTASETYEPPKPIQTLDITTAHTLRGIPVTEGGNYIDANGQRWISDEVDLERGVLVQRIAEKTLTEADITYIGSGYFEYGTYVYTTIRDAKAISTDVVVISDKLLGIRADRRSGFIYDSNYRCYAQDGVVYLRFPAGTGEKTLAECKTAFSGITVQYALATPVETPLSAVEIATYRAMTTVFPNTTVLNNAGAHMIVDYTADTKAYIDNLLKG